MAEATNSVRFESVTPSVLGLAKRAILDTFGVALAGTTTDVWRRVVTGERAISRANLQSGDAAVWGRADRGSAPDAARLNAFAGHALDWDDYTHPMHGHCSAVLVPVCLGLTDEDDSLGGREFLEGFLAGYRINSMMGQLLGTEHYRRGWHATSTLGVFGAVAAAAKVLRLSPETTNHAFGIAASMSSGIRVNFGSMTKPLHAGEAASRGIRSALLASNGITSGADWLTGKHGFLAVYGIPGDLQELQARLNTDHNWFGIDGPWGLVTKVHACCGSSHAMVDGIISLCTRNDVYPRDIEEIRVRVDPLVSETVFHESASNSLQARYSLPATAALAAIHRRADAGVFDDKEVRKRSVQDLMRRVHVVSDLANSEEDRFKCEIEIRTRTTTCSEIVEYPRGHPRKPLAQEELVAKYRLAAGSVLPVEQAEALLSQTMDIESLRNLSSISSALQSPRSFRDAND